LSPTISLTYLSTATQPFGDPELRELLEISRENNHAVELTGMLLYAGGHFIQTLEGPEDVVDATYTRIEKDRRHRNLIVALREQIEKRTFPDWSMGFETLDDKEAAQLPGFNDYLATGAVSEQDRERLGRPGIFHRVFRNNMR
jgi:FAD-dependent sensor of blue light